MHPRLGPSLRLWGPIIQCHRQSSVAFMPACRVLLSPPRQNLQISADVGGEKVKSWSKEITFLSKVSFFQTVMVPAQTVWGYKNWEVHNWAQHHQSGGCDITVVLPCHLLGGEWQDNSHIRVMWLYIRCGCSSGRFLLLLLNWIWSLSWTSPDWDITFIVAGPLWALRAKTRRLKGDKCFR